MKGIVDLYNINKERVRTTNVINLHFKKEVIVEMSKEVFGDDDPCIIHTTYCNKKLGLKLLEESKEKVKDDCIYKITEYPVDLSDIEFPNNIEFIKIR